MPLTDVDMTRDQQIRALQKMVDENLGGREGFTSASPGRACLNDVRNIPIREVLGLEGRYEACTWPRMMAMAVP